MIGYFEKWFSVLSSTGDTGNFFLAIWSLGALVLPFVIVFALIVGAISWIHWRTI